MWDILPHETSKVRSELLLAVPFLEVGLVQRGSRGEEVTFASACNIVTTQLATDDSILASWHLVDSLDMGSGNLFSFSPVAASSSSLSYNFECHSWDLLSNQIATLS